jgi:hypothetical protein
MEYTYLLLQEAAAYKVTSPRGMSVNISTISNTDERAVYLT